MQQNITVIDEEYKTILEGGCKKAKMGETKVLNIKKYSKQQLLSQAPEEVKKEEPNSSQVETPNNNVSFEAKEVVPENKTIQFPNKQAFETRFMGIGATCYSNFPGEVIKTNAARRLRTASIVPESLIHATNSVGVLNEVVSEVKQEVSEEPKKETFDFSQLVNQTTLTSEVNENVKPVPSIDDYFKKEVQVNQMETSVDNTSIELQNARNSYENVLESYKTQCEIQEQLERELQELRQQRVIKIEEYRQKTLEETQNLNDVLTKINQLKDAIDEERRALGLVEEDYKKAI